MQIFALSQDGTLTSASNATRSINYICLECNQVVRLRGGCKRQLHFFHPKTFSACRLHGKTETHLQIQLFLKKHLAPGQIYLEKRFSKINRIADVYWEEKNLIFEIQYSSISQEEIAARIRDYKSIGCTVIWILHDRLFNRGILTAAEEFLSEYPHFFTNFNAKGSGVFYDQYSITINEKRIYKTPPFPINFQNPLLITTNYSKQFSGHLALCLEIRECHWKISFPFDIYRLAFSKKTEIAFSKLETKKKKSLSFNPLLIYRSWFLKLLKKMCS